MKPWAGLAAAFVAFAIADVYAVATGHDAWRAVTKPALMLSLAATVVLATPKRWMPARLLLIVALLFGAVGDTLLLNGDDNAFSLGTKAFAFGHLAYIACFRFGGEDRDGFVRRHPLAIVPYAIAWLGGNYLLWSHYGSLAFVLVPYGLILAAMAVTGLDLIGRFPQRQAWLVAIGGMLFMISDSVLATSRLDPALAPPFSDVIVIVTYIVAQASIAGGMVWGLNELAPATTSGRHSWHP